VGFRLSDEDIAVLDALVMAGEAADRTTALKRTLARERQRQAAEHDALIYAARGPDPELDGLGAWAGRRPIDLD
jgi:hypothetical protein